MTENSATERNEHIHDWRALEPVLSGQTTRYERCWECGEIRYMLPQSDAMSIIRWIFIERNC